MPDNPNPRRITEEEYQRRFHKRPAYPEPERDGMLGVAVVLFVAFAAGAAMWIWFW